jgi:hypothetical protein
LHDGIDVRAPFASNVAGKKAQGQVSEYHDFVIRSLVGIEGVSALAVTARIIGYWIRESEGTFEAAGALGRELAKAASWHHRQNY